MIGTQRLFPLLLALLLAAALPATAQVAPTTAGAQPDGPDWQGFDAAMADAQQSDKLVLVDVYAPWCGYCRKMQKETYTDAAVKAHMDEYFEFARLDGTNTDSLVTYQNQTLKPATLAQYFGATGYPTTVFLRPSGDVLFQQPGFIGADQFALMIEYVGSRAFEDQSFEEFVANTGE